MSPSSLFKQSITTVSINLSYSQSTPNFRIQNRCPREPLASRGGTKVSGRPRGLTGALGPPPLTGQSKVGGCELHGRGSWPSSKYSREAWSDQSQEKPKRRGQTLEDGKGGIPHGPTANPRWRGRNMSNEHRGQPKILN